MKTFIVMRAPCIPEDEGRHFFICRYDSKEAAELWIAQQKGEYFVPSNYYIASTEVE